MSTSRGSISPLALFVALVVLFSLARYLHSLALFLMESPFIDFAHYYTYATVVRFGQSPFDPGAVAQVDSMLNIRRAGAAANYPPLFYLLVQPWAAMPFRLAADVWLLAMQVCLGGALALCVFRGASPSMAEVGTTLFVALNFQPLFESLALGQVNPSLLFLVTLAWWGLRTGRPWVASASVALCPFIKMQYALLLPLLWWMGQRRVFARALLLVAAGLGLGLVMLGPAHHLEFARYVVTPPDYLRTWAANLSLYATLHRLLGTSGQLRRLADVLTLAIDGAILVVLCRAIPRSVPLTSPALDWVWGLGVTAIPLLSPLTEEHHLVVLLFPLALLLLTPSGVEICSAERLALIAGILLVGSRYSLERFPMFQQGVLSLVATGKLLGVACLSWVLLRAVRNSLQNPAEVA